MNLDHIKKEIEQFQFSNLEIVELDTGKLGNNLEHSYLSATYRHKDYNKNNRYDFYEVRYEITYISDDKDDTLKSNKFYFDIVDYYVNTEYNIEHTDEFTYFHHKMSLHEIYDLLNIFNKIKKPKYEELVKLKDSIYWQEEALDKRLNTQLGDFKAFRKQKYISDALLKIFNTKFNKTIDTLPDKYDKKKIKDKKKLLVLYYDNKTRRVYCLVNYLMKPISRSRIISSYRINKSIPSKDTINEIEGLAYDAAELIFRENFKYL